MNAGAMGGWTFDVVESLRYMDYAGGIHEATPEAEAQVEYRNCALAAGEYRPGRADQRPSGQPRSRGQADESLQPETLGIAARRARAPDAFSRIPERFRPAS